MKKVILASTTFLLALVIAAGGLWSGSVYAAGSATLSLSPSSGTFNCGLIPIDVHEDSGATAVNGVQADINYTSAELGAGGTGIGAQWFLANMDNGTLGVTKLAAGSFADRTGDSLVDTRIFTASSSSTTTLTFASSSAITADDGSATDVWDGNTTGGTYTISLSNQQLHPCQTLVKSAGGTVYLISGGKKRVIPTPNIFTSQGYNWNWIFGMTSTDQSLSDGPAVSFRDGTLIKGSSPSVYVVDNSSGTTQKRAITSAAVFNGLGYTSADVLSIAESQLAALPSGSPISSATAHPNGALVSGPGGAIYLVSGNYKRYVGSVYVLYTHGYNNSQIKPATSADLGLTDGSNLPLRGGLLVRSSDSTNPNLYVVDAAGGLAQKRRISTMNVFNGLGYTTGQIITVPASVIASMPDGPSV